jgi:hypothetical protein
MSIIRKGEWISESRKTKRRRRREMWFTNETLPWISTDLYTWQTLVVSKGVDFMTCSIDSLFMVYKSLEEHAPNLFSGSRHRLLIRNVLDLAGSREETQAKTELCLSLFDAGVLTSAVASVQEIDEFLCSDSVLRLLDVEMKSTCSECGINLGATTMSYAFCSSLRYLSPHQIRRKTEADRGRCACKKLRSIAIPLNVKLPRFISTRLLTKPAVGYNKPLRIGNCKYNLCAVVYWNGRHFISKLYLSVFVVRAILTCLLCCKQAKPSEPMDFGFATIAWPRRNSR